MKRLLLSLSMATLGLALSGAAHAGSVSGTLAVTTNVSAACTVTTSPVAFGEFSGIGQTATGDVTVNCTQGLIYNISIDRGLYYNLFEQRRVLALQPNWGAALLYSLFKDSARTAEWGNAGFANTYMNGTSLADTGSGASQPHTVYGLMHSPGPVPAGSYSDTVNVTVNY